MLELHGKVLESVSEQRKIESVSKARAFFWVTSQPNVLPHSRCLRIFLLMVYKFFLLILMTDFPPVADIRDCYNIIIINNTHTVYNDINSLAWIRTPAPRALAHHWQHFPPNRKNLKSLENSCSKDFLYVGHIVT